MRILILSAAVLACFLPASARADEVVKKDGSSVFGYISAETRSTIILVDDRGRRIRIRQTDVESVIESAQTGNKNIDAKTESADVMDADALCKIAEWAKDEGETGWRLVALFAIRADEDHSGARGLLGHIRVGDKWYDDEKDAKKARMELIKEERKAEGYIYVKGGWIKKEDRSDLSKNKDKWVLNDEDTWVDKATYLEEKGLIEIGGKYVKAGTEEDKSDMARFKELMGDDIFIYTSEHFRLAMQVYSPEQIIEYTQLLEQVYDWYHKEFELGSQDVFRGNRRFFWVMKSTNVSQEWFQQYRNRYGLSDTFGGMLGRSGNVLGGALSAHVRTPNEGQDIRHDLVNHAAQFLVSAHSPNLEAPQGAWVGESFGVMAEQVFLELGQVIHSTVQDYGGSGGMAEKKFTTKSAPERAKAMVREGVDDDIVTLDKLELNALSGDHIAKGYTLIDWLFKNEKPAFIKWFTERGRMKNLEAMEAAFGRSTLVLDKEWRKYAKTLK